MNELPGQENQSYDLRKLSDPEFFTQWSAGRNRLFTTSRSSPEYRDIKRRYYALSIEYRRRTGGLAITNMDN